MKMVNAYTHNYFWQQTLADIFNSEKTSELNRQILLQIVRHIDSYEPQCKSFGHSVRVMQYAIHLAVYLHFDSKTKKAIAASAFFHDIGKIGIPSNLLLKKETLTLSEYQMMKRHPEIGGKILQHFPEYDDAVKGVLYHHERFDGSGYPYGLERGEIPIEAQIIGLCDAYDALTSRRPYRKPLSVESAMEILRQQTEYGKWNPFLFSAFENIIPFHEQMFMPEVTRENDSFFS